MGTATIVELRKIVLTALAATDGQISCDDLKELYRAPGDGQRVATIIREGYAGKWVRDRRGNAESIRITEMGPFGPNRLGPLPVHSHGHRARVPTIRRPP